MLTTSDLPGRLAWRSLLVVVLLAGCHQSEPQPATQVAVVQRGSPAAPANLRTMIDDSDTNASVNGFRYFGHWEHVSKRNDGRALGTSSRSFHPGDLAIVTFDGTQVRLYGVLGVKGGYALASIDRRPMKEPIDFYAPGVRTGSLVYTSPVLPQGVHTLALAVAGEHQKQSTGGFVNIDYATVTTPANAGPSR